MAKSICVKCGVEYQVSKIGVTVIEMAFEPPQPYKITDADVHECPSCGNQIITGFANVSAYHHENNFDLILADVLEKEQQDPTSVIRVFERVGDKEKYETPPESS